MAPLFSEADSPLLKTFLIHRLESSSEADPDVLSDYILALLRHDQSPEEVMQTCITQLSDFMTSDPTVFVKDVFQALNTKSYLQRDLVGNNRKRSFDTASQAPPAPYANKYQRQSYPSVPPQPQSYPYIPPPQSVQWPGIPPSRFVPWPGQGLPPVGWNPTTIPTPHPHVPVPSLWPGQPRPKLPRVKGTCFDYIEKGVCLRGASCPYDHGLAPAVISPSGDIESTDPYDPLRPNNTPPAITQPSQRTPLIAGTRFEIHKGANYNDKNNTTLVVEGIPHDKMNESTIRGWFSQFGHITQILIDSSWGKAILVYGDYESAARAWNDPRPVFDNRFVKIWWKKTDDMDRDPNETLSGAIIDEVELEVAKEAAAKAQREHEEKQRKKEELEKKREELERQRVELLEKQKVEREKLMEKIKRAEERAKARRKSVTATPTVESPSMEGTPVVESPAATKVEQPVNGRAADSVEPMNEQMDETTDTSVKETNGTPDETSRKAQLQKMLADLQSQAKALNIPPSEYSHSPLSDSTTRTKTFRGGYRGRGSYPTRGARGRGGSSRSLDLRPKSILVPGIIGTDKETAVREWVILNCTNAECETSVDDEKGLLITFRERYEAEEFLQKLKGPPMGPLTGTWHITVNKPVQNNTATISDEMTSGMEDNGLEKDYVYDDDEEGEIREPEGRWKR